MENTSTEGFYKADEGHLLYGPNFVVSAEFELHLAEKDTYEYPVFGWSYFASEEEARLALNLPKSEEKGPEMPKMPEMPEMPGRPMPGMSGRPE